MSNKSLSVSHDLALRKEDRGFFAIPPPIRRGYNARFDMGQLPEGNSPNGGGDADGDQDVIFCPERAEPSPGFAARALERLDRKTGSRRPGKQHHTEGKGFSALAAIKDSPRGSEEQPGEEEKSLEFCRLDQTLAKKDKARSKRKVENQELYPYLNTFDHKHRIWMKHDLDSPKDKAKLYTTIRQ